VACRNYGRLLPRALDSVLSSALPADVGVQVVVVNDASTDDTALVVEQYRLRNAAVLNAIHRPVSHGAAAAKNTALRRCIGEYAALLDADDEFLPEKLARSVERIEAEGADFLYHDFLVALPNGREEVRRLDDWSLEQWRAGASLPTNTWVFRNGCVEFTDAYVTAEDPNFLLRNYERLKAVYLPEALSRYHLHARSLSSRPMCAVVTGQLRGLRETTVWAE
jgi:glycosyltransferase involved in cell wall biosynthesis